MSDYYYLDSDNNPVGPMSKEEIEQLGLPDSTYVWHEGLPSWVRLSTSKESAKSSKAFFSNLTPFRIVLLAYAVLGSLLMLVVGRFIIAYITYSANEQLDEMPWYMLYLITGAFIPFLFIRKRRYWVHALLLLLPLWIGSFTSGVYYRWMCEDANLYSGRFCKIKKPFRKYGLINQWGIECVPCIYDNISFNNYETPNYCHIFQKDQAGICNLDGSVLVPCEWRLVIRDNIRRLWKVSDNGESWGLLNDDATPLLPCKYDRISNWSSYSQLIKVEKGDWFGLLNPDGTWVLFCNYIQTSFNDDGFAKLNEGGYTDSKSYIKGGHWGVINRKGKVIVPTIYDKVQLYSDEIRGYLRGSIYFYDYRGNLLDVY